MVDCKKCQTENFENTKFCRECGEKLDEDISKELNTIVCIKCDNLNPVDTKFCEQCGAKIIFNKETKLKSKIISALLEQKAWTEEFLPPIDEEGLTKEEFNKIFTEAKLRIENLLKILNKGKKQTNEKRFIEDINFQIKQFNEELLHAKELIEKTSGPDNSFACPYCKREIEIKGGVQDREMEIECELCHKKFKCITGIIKVIRGKPNARVQYGAEPISITLKQNNKEMVVNFKTTFRFLVNRGDRISIIYLKKFLSKSYNNIPSLIYNWSSEEVYKVGVSLF